MLANHDQTRCLVVFRLAQSWFIYVQLDLSWCRFNKAFQPESIDRSLGLINRNSGRMRFLQNSNSDLVCLKQLGFFLFESVWNFVIFLSRRQNTFYNQLLHKARSFENNIIWGWNFFLTLLINISSFIRLTSPKEETNVRKVIIYIAKKIQDSNKH